MSPLDELGHMNWDGRFHGGIRADRGRHPQHYGERPGGAVPRGSDILLSGLPRAAVSLCCAGSMGRGPEIPRQAYFPSGAAADGNRNTPRGENRPAGVYRSRYGAGHRRDRGGWQRCDALSWRHAGRRLSQTGKTASDDRQRRRYRGRRPDTRPGHGRRKGADRRQCGGAVRCPGGRDDGGHSGAPGDCPRPDRRTG